MFIAKNEDLIILASQSREGLEQALQFMVYTDIEETDVEYKLYNGQYLTQEEIDKQELERVSNLTMTSLDLIGYLRQTGLTLKEINDFLDENLELKTQLTYCQNCYCGVVASICPLVIGNVIIDKMQVMEWFKDKNHYIEPSIEVPDIPYIEPPIVEEEVIEEEPIIEPIIEEQPIEEIEEPIEDEIIEDEEEVIDEDTTHTDDTTDYDSEVVDEQDSL